MLDGSNNNNNNNDNDSPIASPKKRSSPKKRTKKSPATPSPSKTKKSTIDDVAITATMLANATMAPGHDKARNGTDDDDDDIDDIDELWNKMYKRLKTYHAAHGNCRVPRSADPDLNYWVQYNHRRMRPEDTRSGARSLTLREEKLLNELDFDPVYKEIVNEFNKYLGISVAKLFHVGNDSSSSSSSSSTSEGEKAFFATVGRISSVCNRVSYLVA